MRRSASHETLLAYLVRRLLENGANSSFVNQIVDENVQHGRADRRSGRQVEHEGSAPHPAIPLPRDLYGAERRNSSGVDFSDEHALRQHWLPNWPLLDGPALAGGADARQRRSRSRGPGERRARSSILPIAPIASAR